MGIEIGGLVWWRGAKCKVTSINEADGFISAIHPKIGPSVICYSKSKPVIRVKATS